MEGFDQVLLSSFYEASDFTDILNCFFGWLDSLFTLELDF